MSTKRRAYVRIVACLFLIALSPRPCAKSSGGELARRFDRTCSARRLGQPIHFPRRIHPRKRVADADPHHHRTAGDVRRRERGP